MSGVIRQMMKLQRARLKRSREIANACPHCGAAMRKTHLLGARADAVDEWRCSNERCPYVYVRERGSR